jgi:two-component system chemotaxis sensor kinase CheA
MVNKLVKGLETQYAGNRDIQNLSELLEEMHKINGTIQTYITDLRKVPLSGVLKPIPRIIRDLAKDLGKTIDLKIDGEKLRVDNAISTVCSASLVHLVRNSADHGIEDTAKRKSVGKPPAGSIQISCRQIGEEVHISIQDDGKGIDPDVIRAKALEKGLYSQSQLAEMNDQQILSIIFAPGFSTAAKVTDVSGRGVGMDMVRSSVEAVGGQISINSKPGIGSTFNLKLPIPKSVQIITALIIETSRQSFAIHQDVIIRVLRIEPSKKNDLIQMASKGRTLRSEDTTLPLVQLSNILALPQRQEYVGNPPTHSITSVLIVESGGLRYALEVDDIHDAEEIVVNRISPNFNPKSAFAGATFMGDGTVGLIIDVKGIAELAGIRALNETKKVSRTQDIDPQTDRIKSTKKDILLFKLASKATYGIPIEQVYRLEEFEASKIKLSGAERVVIYRDGIMPLYAMEKLLKLKATSK